MTVSLYSGSAGARPVSGSTDGRSKGSELRSKADPRGDVDLRGSTVLPEFANIALDIEARQLRDRLFAYRIPAHLAREVFIGSQVMVPFGHRNAVAGFVVSLAEEAPAEIKIVKSIEEVVDADPLFDRGYVDFLYWLAESTCSKLADVLAAALPASLAPRLKRTVCLTDRARSNRHLTAGGDRISTVILNILEQAGKPVSVTTLKRRFKKSGRLSESDFFRALNVLKREELIRLDAVFGPKAKAKIVTRVILSEREAGSEATTRRQKEIVAVLRRHEGSMLLSELIASARTTRDTIKRMCDQNIVRLADNEVVRNPLTSVALPAGSAATGQFELTEHQRGCLETLSTELDKTASGGLQEKVTPWLLYGVTGSGKTEVYLRLIRRALDLGRTALLLVPEISLTPQLAQRLSERFGDLVSVWHSGISQGERYDTWRRLKDGSVKVLLGARSAVLANIPDLGLIILDEEHDGSYKQANPAPRYDARRVALEKARRNGAMVVAGSATPDLATYYRAREEGRVLTLPERVSSRSMPDIQVIDMRQELKEGNRSILSRQLRSQIETRLSRQEQVILLINRRGYASHVFCRACGFVVRCLSCSVSMVFHRWSSNPGRQPGGYLACHHCSREQGLTTECQECGSPFIKEYGLGTQKVEETVQAEFPGCRVARLDSDVAQRKGAYRDILGSFDRGEADVLIGTQMVAKGLDVPNVTLVGVLAADAALNMPDYRSCERGFQLLSQVAGRAGRGDRPGSVIFQTYSPELELFDWASSHDYSTFAGSELESRRQFGYPPFSRIVRVVVSGADPEAVEEECQAVRQIAHAVVDAKTAEAELLGPGACLIEKIKGSYRYQLIAKVKGADRYADELVSGLIDALRSYAPAPGLRLAVDIDAIDLL